MDEPTRRRSRRGQTRFQFCIARIVQLLELVQPRCRVVAGHVLHPTVLQSCVEKIITSDELLLNSVLHQCNKDGIGIKIAEKEDLFHTATRRDWKTSRKIGDNLSLEINDERADILFSVDVTSNRSER